MSDHHAKGQPAASTYVREKGRVTFDTNHDTPCSRVATDMDKNVVFGEIDFLLEHFHQSETRNQVFWPLWPLNCLGGKICLQI